MTALKIHFCSTAVSSVLFAVAIGSVRLRRDKYWLQLCFPWQAAGYAGCYIFPAGLFSIIGTATSLRDGLFGIQTPVEAEDFEHHSTLALGPTQRHVT